MKMNYITKSLKSIFEKKSVTVPQNLELPSSFLWNGINVQVQRYDFLYFKNFVLRAIIDKISNDVADMVPTLDKNNGFWDVINFPNTTQTWRELKKDHIARRLLDGTVYSYLSLNDNGTINTIQTIPNKDILLKCTNEYGTIDEFTMNLYQGYSIKIPNYYSNKFDKRNTLYKWSEFNPVSRFQIDKPKSRVDSVVDTLEYIDLANKFNTTFFKNGARPAYVLSVPTENGYDGKLTETNRQELKKSFAENYGNQNVGGVLILEDGMRLEPLTTGIEKLDIASNIKEMIELACMPFFIQPELLGISSGSTGAAYKVNQELRLYYYNSTIMPLEREWCEYCNRNFVFRYNPTTQMTKYKLGYDETKVDVLMAERYRILESQFRSSVFTVNEIRDSIGMPKLEGMDEVIANTNWGNPNTANYKNPIEVTAPNTNPAPNQKTIE